MDFFAGFVEAMVRDIDNQEAAQDLVTEVASIEGIHQLLRRHLQKGLLVLTCTSFDQMQCILSGPIFTTFLHCFFSSPNGRSKNAHSDLPKSYSQQNSNVKSSEKRHQNRKDKKQRHTSKHHRRREEGNAHKDRDYHSYRRDSSKKHKRKFSPDSPVKLSRVNGDERSPSSPSRKHRHRESHKKKRR